MGLKPDNSEVKAMDTAFNTLFGLKPDERKRVLLWLWEKLEVEGRVQIPSNGSAPQPPVLTMPGQATTIGSLTPKSFMAQKDPKTDLEKITCLAYYRTHHQGTAQFSTKELTKLNTEAAQPNFSNAAAAVSNAARSKYLSPAGVGKSKLPC